MHHGLWSGPPLFFSYTYPTHPCTRRRAAECLCNLMCQQSELPANSPTSGDFKWFQLVPDRAFQTSEKLPFRSAQTQPIQNHADSYFVSERTNSFVVKQVLEKVRAGSTAFCYTLILLSLCSTSEKLRQCQSSHMASIC